jgi:2-dehydro-3-deoxygalactonokinase
MAPANVNQISLIALDWGTTSLRAYALDAAGQVLEKKSAPLGILKIPDKNFDAAFEEICGAWLSDGVRAAPIQGGVGLLACGMIGSRQGWLEAPYVPCPASIDQLARKFVSLTTAKGRRIAIVPGVSVENSAAVPDVIRGEETQIFGALTSELTQSLFILPGTHSKWVSVENNRIMQFATFMTGELFALLCEHSILGRTMKGAADDVHCFKQGYDYAMNENVNYAGLLQQLFSVRTLALFNRLPAEGLHAYLSGLLIGGEIRGGLETFGHASGVTIIAEAALANRYQRALGYSGIHAKVADDNVTAMGLYRLAQAGNLLQ